MVDSESGHCVRVEQHVYPQTVNLMSLHYKKKLSTKRILSSTHRNVPFSRHDIGEKLLDWR